ncbi:cell division protein FtsQ/DivIB [Periweissella fabalis]|uniref:Cell division protein DivIB n=1 Tax=Periweissella fabalis TaxID=1070421 RepID=A0A7X6N3S8_9LACO|nr:cell division protein FtsQ/DivIB [Periweissella fabalis]MCM0598483.1 cell division protein FtsQ/DivIB [Periweissella fabalis]NKZ24237.1 FtsQ-type POTRA domain-containing protein [Periweissella fabalis]
MGDKPEKKNQESSPWDILQIDEANKENKYSQIAEDLFFKRDTKKDIPDTKSSMTDELVTEKIKFTKSPVEKDQFQFVAPKLESDDLINDNPLIDVPKAPNKIYVLFQTLVTNIKVTKLQKQTKQAWATIVAIVLLLGCFYWVISPNSMVQRIDVTGAQDISPKKIVTASGIKVNRSIFGIAFHEEMIKKHALAGNNQIKNLTIHIVSPTHIQINVQEAMRVGYILRHNKYYLVLEGGKILEQPLTTNNLGLPIYEGFKNLTLFNKTIDKFATLDLPIRGAVSEIRFSPTKGDPERIILYMNDGNQVNATIETFADKMAYYPSIAAQMDKPGIVDLQVGAYSYSYEQIELDKAAAEAKKKAEAAKKELAKKQEEAKENDKQTEVNSSSNDAANTNNN